MLAIICTEGLLFELDVTHESSVKRGILLKLSKLFLSFDKLAPFDIPLVSP